MKIKNCSKCSTRIKDRISIRQSQCALCRRNYQLRYHRKNPWYRALAGAKRRCNYPKDEGYRKYGGRGIKCLLTLGDVKYLWLRDCAHLMETPSIDRLDPGGHYELSNCRFLEHSENSRNGAINGVKKRLAKIAARSLSISATEAK